MAPEGPIHKGDDRHAATMLRLQAWLSPAFPTGAFVYSSGLEAAFQTRRIRDADNLEEWLGYALLKGPLWSDALLLSACMERSADDDELAAVALALAPCSERVTETVEQGRAFCDAVSPWTDIPGRLGDAPPLPVAVGVAARSLSLDRRLTVAAFLQAQVTNLLQAAMRLGPVSQSDGTRILQRMEALFGDTARTVCASGLDRLGTSSLVLDLTAMQHAHLKSRIFRS